MKFIRLLLKCTIWLMILSPIFLAGVLLFSLEDTPLVSTQMTLTPGQVESARRLWHLHNPRRAREGELKSISINEEELNLIANYGLNQVSGSATVDTKQGRLDLHTTIRLPNSPFGRYLNLSLGLQESEVLPQVMLFKLGQTPIPAKAANFLIEKVLDRLYSQPDYRFTRDVIEQVRITDQRLTVSYRWSTKITEAVRTAFLSKADQQRLQVIQFHLASVVNQFGSGKRVTLDKLVGPLFRFINDRGDNGDPIADNRAAILVLSAYVNGHKPDKLAPDIKEWAHMKHHRVVLHRRKDLPRHFMVSAALAVTGGAILSQTVGLIKEIDDARRGSGFSFSDLFANNAGTRFGEIAIASETRAKLLQQQLSGPLSEADFIPKTGDLPDHLTETEFKQRYGEIGSAAYQQVVDKIEERIAAMPLYRN